MTVEELGHHALGLIDQLIGHARHLGAAIEAKDLDELNWAWLALAAAQAQVLATADVYGTRVQEARLAAEEQGRGSAA